MSALLLAAVLSLSPSEDVSKYFEVQRLADGVYGVIRKEPPGLAVDCNVVFIVGKKDVVMVDANIGPESAMATLGALRKITDKPIRTIIGTHYHDDHIGGNGTFRGAFPAVEFVGHATTAHNLETLAKPSRKQMIEAAPQMAKFLGDLISKKRSYGGWDLTDEERVSYESDIRIAERYGREIPKMEVIPPTRTVSDKLTLKQDGRTIEILSLGAGHTSSDLVVHLPKERIVVVGDLVVWPVPLVGSNQSHVKAWPKTLERVRALGARLIVPGHGPVLRDDSYLRLLERMFAFVSSAVAAAKTKGETLEQVQKSVDMGSFEREMRGTSKLRKVLFDNYVKEPSIAAAFAGN